MWTVWEIKPVLRKQSKNDHILSDEDQVSSMDEDQIQVFINKLERKKAEKADSRKKKRLNT